MDGGSLAFFFFLEFGLNFNFQCQCCAKSLALHKDSENISSDKREMMKGEVLLLIISVALTVIVYILIVFIKKFIRSRPPGRRLVTSDIQVVVGNSKFRGSATLHLLGPKFVPGSFPFRRGYYRDQHTAKRVAGSTRG